LLRRMLSVFREDGGRIVAAAHGDLVAPPVVFPREFFRELKGLEGDQGARAVIAKHSESVSLVRVRSKRVFADVDTREDLRLAVRLLEP